MPMVLSISYSDVQQRTMQRTLASRGIDLTGVKSLHDALALCPQHYFDLVIVDDSIPFQDREFICARLKMECEAPLLVLIAPNEVPIQSAQYNLQGGEFASFTEVVSRILQQKGTSA